MSRRRNYGFVAGCLILSFIICAMLFGINSVLTPKYYLNNSTWPTTSSINKFYKMKQNTVDVLFLGSSVAVNQFIPQLLYDEYGIRSFNLGSEQQSVILSYYWLKEALRFQNPKIVVLEALFLQDCHPDLPINTTEGLIRKCIDPMRWSSVKLEAVRDICQRDPSQNARSYYFKNIRFHDRWKSLTENDFVTDGIAVSQLLGWAPGDRNPAAGSIIEPFEKSDDDTSYQLRKDMVVYFEKIVELCEENDIQLILVKTPQEGNVTRFDYAYRKLAEEYDVDYYNLQESSLFERIKTNPEIESIGNHGNIWGNITVSRFIGGILSDNYMIPTEEDIQYEGLTRSTYNHILESYRLKLISDIDEYLAVINDESFAVFISQKDDAAAGMRESTKELLRALGLDTEWTYESMFRKSYLAVISDDEIKEKSGGPISMQGAFRNKNSRYSMFSAGYEDEGGAKSSIVIDGKEYSMNSRGLNIVVYDLYLQKVVDQICFDTCSDSSAKRA